MNFGMEVKLKRVSKNIKQYELADRANISREYLRLIEKNQANPTKAVIEKIARELDTPVSELFSDRS